jgi:uncharacterized protein (DUF433 family)
MEEIDTKRESMFGEPVLSGTTITVDQVLRVLYAGASPKEAAEGLHVDVEKVRAALLFAGRAVEEQYPNSRSESTRWSHMAWTPSSVEKVHARRLLTVLTSNPVTTRSRLKSLLELKLTRLIEDYRRFGDPICEIEYFLNTSVLANNVSAEIAQDMFCRSDRLLALQGEVDWESEDPEPKEMTVEEYVYFQWRMLDNFLEDLVFYHRFEFGP